MIVVDTNVIAYSLIEGAGTVLARQVRTIDSDWRIPDLWRYEFLNILATYRRCGGLGSDAALSLWKKAETLFENSSYVTEGTAILKLAGQYAISAYDAHFIALARELGARCVTEDKKLLRLFPDIAVSMKAFCQNH